MQLQNRNSFPALSQNVNGHALHYLDNAASTLKPQCVIDAVTKYYSEYSANVHRGIHSLSERATEAFESSRETVARFIHVQPEEIIFTSGTTESLNGIAQMLGDSVLKNGDEILVTELEHHSNIVPWFIVAKRIGATVRFVPVNKDGTVTPEQIEKALTSKTKVLAVTMMSNALGTTVDIEEVCTIARSKNILTIVDAAQAVVHQDIDVKKLGCDFLAFSGHKLYGPTGVGVLFGKSELLNRFSPWKGGGGMIREVTTEGFITSPPPSRFEAGTPHIAGVIGLAEAIRFALQIGFKEIVAHEQSIATYARETVRTIKEVTLYGPADLKSPIISFNIAGIHAHDVAAILDETGVAIRAGHHCCQPLMKRLGTAGTARASIGLYNTKEDIDALVEGIRATIRKFK